MFLYNTVTSSAKANANGQGVSISLYIYTLRSTLASQSIYTTIPSIRSGGKKPRHPNSAQLTASIPPFHPKQGETDELQPPTPCMESLPRTRDRLLRADQTQEPIL